MNERESSVGKPVAFDKSAFDAAVDCPHTVGHVEDQKARTVWSIGTQPVIPAVYGVKAPL